MVYCPSCGTKNEDAAQHCVQCGESLFFDDKSRPTQRSSDLCYEWADDKSKKKISQRGILIIGALIAVWGFSQLSSDWLPKSIQDSLWPTFILAVGVIVVIYALFFFRRDN